VSDEDLPPVHDVGKWDCGIVLPVLQCSGIINEYDEVVRLALVEDLVGRLVGAHCGECMGVFVVYRVESLVGDMSRRIFDGGGWIIKREYEELREEGCRVRYIKSWSGEEELLA
jgi:hypothetical protein